MFVIIKISLEMLKRFDDAEIHKALEVYLEKKSA